MWWSVPQTPVVSTCSSAPPLGTARSAARTEPGPCSSTTRTVVREASSVRGALIDDTVNRTSYEAAAAACIPLVGRRIPHRRRRPEPSLQGPEARLQPVAGAPPSVDRLPERRYDRLRAGQGVAACGSCERP